MHHIRWLISLCKLPYVQFPGLMRPDPCRCSTFHHVRCCCVCGVLVSLSYSAQILQNVDVWCKVDHVLFPAAVRHLDQGVQAADGGAEDVTFIAMETRQIRHDE